MAKNERVLMETFEGFDIYYDKHDERFIAEKPKLNIKFEARTLWEIKGDIKQTRTKEVDKQYLIKSGYFNKSLAKVHIMTENTAMKSIKYKVLEDTEKSYDVGMVNDDDIENMKLYPLSKENLDIYNKIVDLEKEIKKIEGEQQRLVRTIK